jgi:hypothetical protein
MPIQDGRVYGKFKALLLSPEELKFESSLLRDQFLGLKSNWNYLTPPLFLWEWLKIYLSYRIQKKGHRTPNWGLVGPPDWNSEIFGFHEPLRMTLKHWNQGKWDLILTDHLPSSEEMAYIQSQGKRYVSLDWDSCLNGSLVEDARDSLEHVLHDLAHAYTFFESKYQMDGQVNFFRELVLDLPRFQIFSEKDPIFKKKFEYCLADMNSHPEHLKAYLKAVTLEYYLRREGKRETNQLSQEGREEYDNFISQIQVFTPKNLV